MATSTVDLFTPVRQAITDTLAQAGDEGMTTSQIRDVLREKHPGLDLGKNEIRFVHSLSTLRRMGQIIKIENNWRVDKTQKPAKTAPDETLPIGEPLTTAERKLLKQLVILTLTNGQKRRAEILGAMIEAFPGFPHDILKQELNTMLLELVGKDEVRHKGNWWMLGSKGRRPLLKKSSRPPIVTDKPTIQNRIEQPGVTSLAINDTSVTFTRPVRVVVLVFGLKS